MPKGASEMPNLQRERQGKGMRLFRWRLPYGSLMQMRHCHRRCCCSCYCCSAAGWPILINCKSLLVTRACLGIRASPVQSTPLQWRRISTGQTSHGNTSAASGFSFLFFFAAQRINNKNAGNKLHNTRMLSRKLVLIFKALHYSQPQPEPEQGRPTRSAHWGNKRKLPQLKSMLWERLINRGTSVEVYSYITASLHDVIIKSKWKRRIISTNVIKIEKLP